MKGKEALKLQIPKDVLEHARRSGISIEEFRKSLELFGTMQLISETSRLSMRGAGAISEKIKEKSWLRTGL